MWPKFGFPGWKLAVVGVREGGAGHGLLLCHLHRQLHGSELRQAPAAAEALRGENQVMTRQSRTNIQVTVFLLPPRALQLGRSHPQLDNKPHPPHPIHSQRLNAQTTRHYSLVCVCVCVRGCTLLRMYVLFTVRPSPGFCSSLSSSHSVGACSMTGPIAVLIMLL